MCGILGGNFSKWNYAKALNAMAHRGPDSEKLVCFDELTMGFVRLSVMDLTDKAMQPMTYGRGNITITCNGEIYGYAQVKEMLQKRGYQFRTGSDTEAVLYAYAEWGDGFVNYIDGMFAIAIYDRNAGRVKLFRDRAGIKPVYYFCRDGYFAYASELKGLVCLLDNIKLDIDNTAIYDFYNYLYVPDPKTMYKNIYKLEQAHKLVYDLKAHRIESDRAYWELKVNGLEGNRGPSAENIQTVREKISEAVRQQMVADVPVGAFLSGGMDSSVITREALKIYPDFNAYSIGFYDFQTNELPYVNCLEDFLGFKANKYYVRRSDFLNLYSRIREWFDEPFCDTSAYPTYFVARKIREKCTVALSGDGGDEIFGGYTRYHWFSEQERAGAFGSDEDALEYIWAVHLYMQPDRKELRQLFHIDDDYDEKWFYKKYYRKDLPPVTRMQYMDFYTYLPCDVLTKTDRVSMAVSLEARVPFLSTDIIEYGFSLTQNERCPKGELKGIVKLAYEEELPANLIYRRKWGFGIPDSFFGHHVLPQEKILSDLFGDIKPNARAAVWRQR